MLPLSGRRTRRTGGVRADVRRIRPPPGRRAIPVFRESVRTPAEARVRLSSARHARHRLRGPAGRATQAGHLPTDPNPGRSGGSASRVPAGVRPEEDTLIGEPTRAGFRFRREFLAFLPPEGEDAALAADPGRLVREAGRIGGGEELDCRRRARPGRCSHGPDPDTGPADSGNATTGSGPTLPASWKRLSGYGAAGGTVRVRIPGWYRTA